MGFEGAFPKTSDEYKEYVDYLENGVIPERIAQKRHWSWRRKLEHWCVQDGLLYLRQPNKPLRRFVPAWDDEFRASLFERFHTADRHISHNACYPKITEQYVGITKEDVRRFINACSVCARTSSIKERDDLTPVVANGPYEHLQMDLIDLTHYKNSNKGMCWLLTVVCIFSKFLWAFPLKNKEAARN